MSISYIEPCHRRLYIRLRADRDLAELGRTLSRRNAPWTDSNLKKNY
jgi:hypothetical protein